MRIKNRKFYYGKNEFGMMDSKNKTYYKYDFVDNLNKKIIEFNGEYFHPKLENDPSFKNPYSDVSSKDAWARDRDKELLAKNNGYDILYIWENEFRNNKDGILNKCIKFLKGELDDVDA